MKFLKASALMAVLLVCAVLMLGVLSLRVHPVRGGSGGATEKNGDVNCDGKIDISDAISIIQWQLMGGAEPCALAQDASIIEKLNSLGDQISTLQNSLAALAPTWPPKPEDMVNLAGTTPAIGADVVIYTVPAGRILVLTGLSVPDPGDGIDVVLNNTRMNIRFKSYISASGFPLPSGSKITLTNSQSGRIGLTSYLVTGYLRNP